MQDLPAFPGVPGLERWTPPDFSDLEAVARALDEACADAAPAGPLRVLGEGFFSVAVVTASGMVFRLGTSPDVFARYQKEWRVLPWLASKGLPLEIPRPRWLLEPTSAFPFGGIGSPLIEGRTLTEADVAGPHRGRFAEQIAAFNLALHRLPIEEAVALGVPDGLERDRHWNANDRATVLVALVDVLPSDEFEVVTRWWVDAQRHVDFDGFMPAFVHNDINGENLVVDDAGTRVVAVIDFEHCSVGDVLHDFRNLQYLGRDFCLETVAAYERLGGRVYEGFSERLEWDWQRGAFPSIRRAWQRGDAIDANEVRARLRRHGVLPSE